MMDIWNGSLRLDDSNEIRGKFQQASSILRVGTYPVYRHTNQRAFLKLHTTARMHLTISLPCRYLANTFTSDLRQPARCLDYES